jgi:hypothetical protein
MLTYADVCPLSSDAEEERKAEELALETSRRRCAGKWLGDVVVRRPLARYNVYYPVYLLYLLCDVGRRPLARYKVFYAVYLLYQYKSANTDIPEALRAQRGLLPQTSCRAYASGSAAA